jgi:large subunit ribosomal protein L17
VRHQRAGKKLGRDPAHRKALYANLAGALIEHGRIKTTITKAKAVRPIAEQMITLGRRGDIHARRQAVAFLRSKDVVHKLFTEVGPAYAARPGGYTLIVRIGPRQGDASEMAYLELVDSPLVFKTKERATSEHEAPPEPAAGEAPEPIAESETAALDATTEGESDVLDAADSGEDDGAVADAPDADSAVEEADAEDAAGPQPDA